MSTLTARHPGFREALAFEWAKFASLRSTRWTTVTIGLVTVVGAVFVGLSGSLQPDDTVLGGSLTLSVVSLMIAGVVGALTICGEYASGTLTSTLAAVPRRGRVLLAKAVLLAGLLYGLSLVACTAAYLLGGAILEDGTYAQGEPMPALLGIAGLFAVVGVLGLAIGVLVRHSAGAVTAVIAVMLLPSLFGPLFGDMQRWVAGATPTAALEKLTQTADASPEAVGSLGAWPSLALVAAYTVVLLALATQRLRRRDA
ncbi:ABC transporter permease subunit [Streptomyces flavofungini]|uniref:ABC transporter permease subunit n=1 Tax=Streptomyces flavofungini TaxID=68200 RepID=A0ABS0XHH8_9ACTN|nr:ABC transporter permease subunit [Streptomyces flavofungini]MBJ3812670.1 ABC transporter permease subunit [Streptomyces flavofungini]GHC89841.1 ABC transporter [Streptomyces flavofungini]